MQPVYLLGGGGGPPTYGRFLAAALARGDGPVVLVVAGESSAAAAADYADYHAIFTRLGARDERLAGLLLTAADRLTVATLQAQRPAAIFLCGGLTPLYWQTCAAERDWLAYARSVGILIGGESAGAAILGQPAIVGGWQVAAGGTRRQILFQGAAEGRDLLDVRPGLGAVPFAVDIHASQWGTLTRAIHTLHQGLAGECWAIDENTLLVVGAAGVEVYGLGQAYHLQPTAGGGVTVRVHPASMS